MTEYLNEEERRAELEQLKETIGEQAEKIDKLQAENDKQILTINATRKLNNKMMHELQQLKKGIQDVFSAVGVRASSYCLAFGWRSKMPHR